MDAKALAKSKRAHSQHHSKKPRPSQKPKPPLAAATGDAANAKTQTGKQIREKTRQAQPVSVLPSNWDRYEDEFDSASEDQSGGNASQAPDAIVPKSKGADYRHLIANAESQLQSNPYSDSFPSLDDVLPGDFNQFVGSMLSVRGEGILSWIGNDNFVVEDRTTATPKASFLSLNLHALAEQLEKVDLSERLFMEEDLLPPELQVERSKANNHQKSDQMETTSGRNTAALITEELTSNDFPEKVNIAAQNVEHTSFGSGGKSADATLSNGGRDLANESCGDFISSQHGKSGETKTLESSIQDISNSVSVSNKNVLTFEVAAAEAELDKLLDSFSETKLLDSSGSKPKIASSDFGKETFPSLRQLATKAVSSTFDDILDDLLQETSSTVKQNDLSRQMDVEGAPDSIQSSSSSHSVSKLKVLNDFDSWLDTI
ncbi:hypothetical protein CCACVL1_28149 [Corchorus capsularis]|uniref:Uncharacterized protein n=1 Tax=Corchorus capsularis TaxID=210143 RepID=A0A1R3G7D7_COCAP|nr:hypothetical protein CCACVL1_28149 [Corchorus capsularis]